MLVVVDEFWDGAEVVLLRQVKLPLRGGADVIMSAAATGFPAVSNDETGGHLSTVLVRKLSHIMLMRVGKHLPCNIPECSWLLESCDEKFCRPD